jgi:hypothetical protein
MKNNNKRETPSKENKWQRKESSIRDKNVFKNYIKNKKGG